MSDQRWLIQSVDLATGLPEITLPHQAAGVHLQLWWRACPIGQLWLPRETLPMASGELLREAARQASSPVGDRLFRHGFRAPLPVIGDNPARDTSPDFSSLAGLTHPLAQLVFPPLPSSPVPTVSIIICTRRRSGDLRRCLASLAQLDPPPAEILVVNNDPSDESTRDVAQSFPGIQCVDEPQPGLSRARNTGLRNVTGDIIAWTDDDTVALPKWVEAIRRVFLDPAISGMTGLVLPGSLETPSQLRFERDFGGFNRGYRAITFDPRFFSEMKDRGVPVWMVGAGANMAFRRSVFEKLGGFDERLGAGAAGCSEDSEFWYRMLNAGLSLRYEPLAVVDHFHRVDEEGFSSQMVAYMRGHVFALLVQYEKYGHSGNLRRLFLSLPRYYWGVICGRLEGGERGTIASEILGCLEGVGAYLIQVLRRGLR
ncbi:hypothetical protein BH09VER1_BH09VER1_19080 [soil metagenome]